MTLTEPREDPPVPSAVQPVLVTRDLDRLVRFHAGVAGAVLTDRVPDDCPVFYQGLQIADSDLGIVADAEARSAPPAGCS